MSFWEVVNSPEFLETVGSVKDAIQDSIYNGAMAANDAVNSPEFLETVENMKDKVQDRVYNGAAAARDVVNSPEFRDAVDNVKDTIQHGAVAGASAARDAAGRVASAAWDRFSESKGRSRDSVVDKTKKGIKSTPGFLEKIGKTAKDKTSSFARNHPYATGTIVGGSIVAIAPATIVAPFLGITGFGAGGVAAATAAAGAQAGIGNVAAGSVFATLQSAGAGGAGLSVVNGVVSIAGVGLSAAGAAVAALTS